MKKILLVLNHSLAGFGSDEQAQLKPSGKKLPLGPGVTLLPFYRSKVRKLLRHFIVVTNIIWKTRKR